MMDNCLNLPVLPQKTQLYGDFSVQQPAFSTEVVLIWFCDVFLRNKQNLRFSSGAPFPFPEIAQPSMCEYSFAKKMASFAQR